jgi:HSP20 family protein
MMTEKNAKEEKVVTKEKPSAVAPWRPFEESERWPQLFGGWPFSGRRERIGDAFAWPWAGRAGAVLPAMDVSENDHHYAITVELPGVRKEDVHVELEQGVLTIRGEKTSEREEKKEHSRYTERSYGSFSRSCRLPSDADADRLEASFQDGVLAVTIPRSEEVKPRTIAIKAS